MESNKLTQEQKIEKLQSMLAKAKPENPLQYLLYWNQMLFTQSGPLDENVIKNIAENPTNKIIENPLDKIIEQRKLKDKERLEQIQEEIKEEPIQESEIEEEPEEVVEDESIIEEPKEPKEFEFWQAKGVMTKMESKYNIIRAIFKLEIDNMEAQIKLKKKEFAQIIANQFNRKVSYILKLMQFFHNQKKFHAWLKKYDDFKKEMDEARDKFKLFFECNRLYIIRLFKKYTKDKYITPFLHSVKRQSRKLPGKVYAEILCTEIDKILT